MTTSATDDQARAALQSGLDALRRGQPAQAEPNLRAFLIHAPDHVDARHLLGSALGQLGQLDEARALVEEAIARDGRRAAFHNTLGNILKAQGAARAAMRAYARALELEPKMIGASFNLGLIHLEAGRLDAAAMAFDDVLRVMPANFDALMQRGLVAWRLGDMSTARRDFESAVRCRAGSEQARTSLGVVLMHEGEFALALESFEHAHALAPEKIGPQLHLAQARRALGDFVGAAAVLSAAVGESPEHAGLLRELGGVRQAQGDLDEARRCFAAALMLDQNPITAAALAELHLWNGETTRAAMAIKPFDDGSAPQVAIVRARLALASGDAAPDLSAVNAWFDPGATPPVGAAVRRQLHFCAGDLHHARAEWDAAFAHWGAGNALVPARFDARANEDFVDQQIRYFDAGRWSRLARTNAADVGPLFIVGMPRSGTTLLEQMLGMHPLIGALGERPDVGLWHQALSRDAAWPQVLDTVTTGQLNTLARQYLKRLDFNPKVAWISDKMPLNFMHLGLIAMVFPRARVVHCRRDASAVALSCYRQDFSDPALAFATDLVTLGRYVGDYERLMAHWQQVLALPITEVHYEDLVTDPERALRAVLASLELPFDPACLSFHRSARFVNTASHQQVRRPLYTEAVNRHEAYAAQLEPFTLALAQKRAHSGPERL